MDDTSPTSLSGRIEALLRVAKFRPLYAVGLILLSFLTSLLEGIGLTFILPIVEFAQSQQAAENANGLLGLFVRGYELLGIPFTLEFLFAGVSLVMITRYTLSFVTDWYKSIFKLIYMRHLQESAFDSALSSETSYFDQTGSDRVLNAIVTQAANGAQVISSSVNIFEQFLLLLMYFGISLYVAPLLTLGTVAFLGCVTVLIRFVLEPGQTYGKEAAEAKERIQTNAQAGTQGIRDVKLFGLQDEIYDRFVDAVRQYEDSFIRLQRNSWGITNFYNLITAVSVFLLMYVALRFTSLALGSIGVFLFAMFRLGPKVSTINQQVYDLEGQLPHLIRTHEFLDELNKNGEPKAKEESVPGRVETVSFENVRFQYETSDEIALDGVSFSFDRGDFVAFVGPSGAGKSTIASLLARLYEPDSGRITANGTNIQKFHIADWRSKIAVVRQSPHIFNETLWWNLTVGNRGASRAEVERACEIAQVTEFLDDLEDGYDTVLGDDGVRLSGGQRQRVAIARALIQDADLLILDEGTSELDSSLEQQVHDAIESMDRDCALLVIAHRLSTVTGADEIYAMEDGKIVESGDHKSLLVEDGQYAELYALQEG